MNEKDREIWVGKTRIYLGEDNIIYGYFVGDADDKIATAICKAHLKLMNHVEGKVNFFTDLNKAGKPSAEAKKILHKFNMHEKIGKIAMCGIHPVARVLTSFMMSTSKKKDVRFFKTKEEALAWLKE